VLQISVKNSKKNPESYSQNRACNIAHNGKGLCEVRATATRSGEENETLAKTIFIFFKFIKKNEMVFLRVLLTNFLRFPSTPHLAKPMLYDVFL